MEKERRIKALVIVSMLVAMIGLTIAFAALSQTLSINGSAYLDAAKWGIKFQNLENPVTTGEASVTKTAIIESDVSINNIGVKLNVPGDSVKYKVDLVNEGTINAKIEKIEKTALTSEQERYLTFKVEDEAGKEITEGEILNAGETKNVTIIIEFKKDIEKEDLPSALAEINITYKLNFVQTEDKKETTTPVVQNNCTNFEKKDTYNVGDVIAICNSNTGVSEDFYVIKDNGSSVTALAKYNLLVGNTAVWNEDFSETTSLEKISSSEEGYGLQSAKAANYNWDTENGVPVTNTITGSIAFANKDDSRRRPSCTDTFGCHYGYWTDVSTHNLLPTYGSSYPANVYDSNSNLYTPVQNYEGYIKSTLGKTSVSVSVPTYSELIGLGCSRNDYSCTSAPAWVYSVNYWTASADDEHFVWSVYSFGTFDYDYFDIGGALGVRPVITISKSDI